MEALADTPWDVTISGTGLAQSLLALALSRSGKKILHVDKNTYYGGSEAAFSLEEAQEWVDLVNQDPRRGPFEDASIQIPSDAPEKSVSASRAYTLSLSPFIVYSRSKLLPTLVSSRVYRQLEFQAVGSWWIHGHAAAGEESQPGRLQRVPSSREDIFADDSISMKAKRMLIKFLRSINQPAQMGEQENAIIEEDLDVPFPEYLKSKFNAPPELYDALASLSLTQQPPQQTSAKFAVARIQRHLSSMGVFGPGFGSLLSKWGCGAEIAQVGCRALAVGGGVYVLGRGIESIDTEKDEDGFHQVTLTDGEKIRSRYIVGSEWDLPVEERVDQVATHKVARSISVISSPLERLFPPTAEGGPVPAGAVVVVPEQTLGNGDLREAPPVYLLVHSSDTGECPDGQCVIYGSISVSGQAGQSLLEKAVDMLLKDLAANEDKPTVLWRLGFTQVGVLDSGDGDEKIYRGSSSDQVLIFPPPSLDLSFDDRVIDSVRAGWGAIVGDEGQDGDFMQFEDRETYDDD